MKSPYACRWDKISTKKKEKKVAVATAGQEAYHGEAVAVKDHGVQQLAESQRLQHPASPPPRPGPLYPAAMVTLFPSPDHAIVLGTVPAKLQRAKQGVEGNGYAQLLRRVDAQGEAGQRRADRGRIGRRQRAADARVALAKGRGRGVQHVDAQPGEEAEEQSVQKQDRAEGERQPESG